MQSRCVPCLLACILYSTTAIGQETVRIEEDWELHVLQPDAQIDAPQIAMTMVPFGNLSDLLFQVDLNHATSPSFSAGGIQVRVAFDDDVFDTKRFLEGVRLTQSSETVSWTQIVQKSADGYYFGVANGASTSLGSFGGDASFIHVPNSQTGVVSLNAYDANLSLQNSGVTYAGNRVAWLRLKKLRLFNSLGQSAEWTLNSDVN